MRLSAAALMLGLLAALPSCKASVNVKADASLDNDGEDAEDDGQAFTGSAGPSIEPPPGPPTATYPGFRVLPNGSSLVRVEVSRLVDVEAQQSQNILIYRLKGARAPEKVNRLPLISQHFSTRISQISLQQAGEDVDVVIELREGAKGEHRIFESEGQMVLEVTVPPWTHGTFATTDPND